MALSRDKYRRQWLSYHRGYEKRALTELRKVFKTWGNAIRWEDINENNYQSQISNSFDITLMNEAYQNIYTQIGLVHGNRVGKAINTQLKNFDPFVFLSDYENTVMQYLFENGLKRVILVRKLFFEEIIDMISNRIADGKDIHQISKEIHRIVNSRRFYFWQSQRIARTESTGAANYAATKAGDVSGFIMEKEWISATDARVRRKPEAEYDHREMNGKRIPRHDKFQLRSSKGVVDLLEYPGDPKGQPGDIINCRCTVAIVPKRDKNGRLIPTK